MSAEFGESSDIDNRIILVERWTNLGCRVAIEVSFKLIVTSIYKHKCEELILKLKILYECDLIKRGPDSKNPSHNLKKVWHP